MVRENVLDRSGGAFVFLEREEGCVRLRYSTTRFMGRMAFRFCALAIRVPIIGRSGVDNVNIIILLEICFIITFINKLYDWTRRILVKTSYRVLLVHVQYYSVVCFGLVRQISQADKSNLRHKLGLLIM